MPISEQHHTKSALIAFETAQAVAERMVLDAAVGAANIALADGYDDYLDEVRRVVMDAKRQAIVDASCVGGTVGAADYDGSQLCEAGFGGDDVAAAQYWDQLTAREESGYLLGLAVGLMLGKGGAR